MISDNPWTPEKITQLRVLWGEGHSTAEIGRCMGVSKNSVVGKVHRLDLPSRPSPIRPAQPPARISLIESADLSGLRVGKRVVMHRLPMMGDRPRPIWNVRCDCGEEGPVLAFVLVGPTPPQSCKQCSTKIAAAKRFESNQRPKPPVTIPAPVVQITVPPQQVVQPLPKPYVRLAPDPFNDELPRSLTCEWIVSLGSPVKKCGEVAVRGKSYCKDHGATCVFTRESNRWVRGYAASHSDRP